MNPRNLDVNRLIEKGALTEKNGCSIFALAGAIAVLEPNLTENQFTDKVKSIISTPIETTPLHAIAQRKNLPAPLLLENGSVTAIKWINEGEGDALMSYLNSKFYELDLNIDIGFRKREIGKESEEILESVKSGTVVLLPCSIFNNNEFDSNHHISLAFDNGEFIIIDINNPVTVVNESLLISLLNDSDKRIIYGSEDEKIAINDEPVIFLKKRD